MVGLIKDNSESAYREEVKQVSSWCSSHNLFLNVDKTSEVVIYFRRTGKRDHVPLFIKGTAVKKVSSVKYLKLAHIRHDRQMIHPNTCLFKVLAPFQTVSPLVNFNNVTNLPYCLF